MFDDDYFDIVKGVSSALVGQQKFSLKLKEVGSDDFRTFVKNNADIGSKYIQFIHA